MRQITSTLLAIAFLSGCSFVQINHVPSELPPTTPARQEMRGQCKTNLEASAPTTDLIIGVAGLALVGLGLALEFTAPPDTGDAWFVSVPDPGVAAGRIAWSVGSVMALLHGSSAIYGYTQKGRCERR